MSAWLPIEYDLADDGSIQLPDGSPFDGTAVLIKTTTGVVEAWWYAEDGYWVCYDDQFSAELDDAKFWMPIPA